MGQVSMAVAVVGSGYMGKGIAQTLARGGAAITLADRDAATARAALESMLEEVRVAEEAGLVPAGSTDAVRERSRAASSIAEGVAHADFVVEAVPEVIELKHDVLRVVEAAARPDAVIATNTSAIPVTDLAAVLERPERFFGVHWFNPAPYLPAVEIILGDGSDASLLSPVTALLVAAGKAPVVVADTPGFICNRLQFALFKEAALMVEEGSATPEQIDGVVRSSFGYRLPFFGPFAIADMAGLDVYASSYATLESKLGERFTCPPSLRARVDAGDLGTKTGGGFLEMSAEQAKDMAERRDRSYVALAALRDSLES
ncbi:3-hydroxyacyl-CoA dehydrogenase family protein [Nocardioides acrostichi]|uniref:3-hydroxyacyl-CoA dehydrogenase family protein n=1 Tax=Nocardioides acrostichi TaxID=2784339 RepID=A0A930UTX5_9ACTN|nr:3-hydroxyacyl-CoA dehydrogenase family protein [Nocardioides acrostichi]MBF4160768.1 3-hydroxyacyl-CoA dehydrogenase family protein [Nocardioides acrostichi]